MFDNLDNLKCLNSHINAHLAMRTKIQKKITWKCTFKYCICQFNMDPCSGNGVVSGPAVTVNNQGNQKNVQTFRNYSNSKSLNIGFLMFRLQRWYVCFRYWFMVETIISLRNKAVILNTAVWILERLSLLILIPRSCSIHSAHVERGQSQRGIRWVKPKNNEKVYEHDLWKCRRCL